MNCPFYARHAVGEPFATLVDTGGNQCALILDALAPCVMEVSDQKEPDAWRCPLIAAANAEYLQRRPGVRRSRDPEPAHLVGCMCPRCSGLG